MGIRISDCLMESLSFESGGQVLQGDLYRNDSTPALPGDGSGQYEKSRRFPRSAAVIICHGAFEDRGNWSTYARRLAEQGFPTLVFDFVGHGSSGGQRGMVEMHQWAYNIRDALNALGKLGFRRFALVGWGSGGSAALLAAAHDRRLVCTVVLAAPIQIIPPLSERIVYTLATAASKVWKALKKKPLTFSREQAYMSMDFALDTQADAAYKENLRLGETLKAVPIPESLDSVWVDITKALANIKAPVLIVHGVRDAIVPVKQSEKLYKLLPGRKKLILVEDAGHALHFEPKKDAMYSVIARWIKHYLSDLP